jgi:predicted porin
MNNKIKLAVAGAVLSAASVANAGIIIPAGEWTLDVNGNVNVFATFHDITKDNGEVNHATTNTSDGGEDNSVSINTGLLPAWLGFTGTTRQNDLDVSFTISMQPNVSDNTAGLNLASGDQTGPLWRQAFITFGDKSWGSVKMGKDLGIYGGEAILSDMTLLGVGAGQANTSGAATTLGGIGTGYIYPAWKGQIAYTTPNFNGFQATLGITNPNQINSTTNDSNSGVNNRYQTRFGLEGNVSYSWTGASTGKVWLGAANYDVNRDNAAGAANDDYTVNAYEAGAKVTVGNLGLTGYIYNGRGAGIITLGQAGYDNDTNKRRDSNGGYIQATYVIPTGTKLGVAYGRSTLDEATGETNNQLVDNNKRWTVGAYHPLTKHLNLVAEYNDLESEGQGASNQYESRNLSLGAILFF